MNHQSLILSIRTAFKDVTLEDGIGLYEAQAIDDYADEATRKKHREEDEKNDWSLISIAKLELYEGSMSFFDPKGMRFHLPAFMLAQLESEKGRFDITGFLVDFWNENKRSSLEKRFHLLSEKQRKTVVEFLKIMRDDPDALHSFNDFGDIQKALDQYWETAKE